MKAFVIINLINLLLSLSVTIFYVYPKGDIFICVFFFAGILYFLKKLWDQILLSYGKSIK